MRRAKHRMKGDIPDITYTLFTLLVAIAVVIFASLAVLFLFLKSFIGGGQISHEFELIGISIRPFSLAESLSSYKPNDRSFLENALESSIAGSLSKSDSQNMQTPLKDFLDFLGLKSYEAKIEKGQLVLFRINNFVVPCGNGGMCISSLGRKTNVCSEGRSQLPDNTCSSGKVCCSIAVSESAKKCGEQLKGVCTSVRIDDTDKFALLPCGEGRQQINDLGFCSPEKVCCKYIEVVEIGILSRAEIPLVYKGQKVGDIKVETG